MNQDGGVTPFGNIPSSPPNNNNNTSSTSSPASSLPQLQQRPTSASYPGSQQFYQQQQQQYQQQQQHHQHYQHHHQHQHYQPQTQHYHQHPQPQYHHHAQQQNQQHQQYTNNTNNYYYPQQQQQGAATSAAGGGVVVPSTTATTTRPLTGTGTRIVIRGSGNSSSSGVTNPSMPQLGQMQTSAAERIALAKAKSEELKVAREQRALEREEKRVEREAAKLVSEKQRQESRAANEERKQQVLRDAQLARQMQQQQQPQQYVSMRDRMAATKEQSKGRVEQFKRTLGLGDGAAPSGSGSVNQISTSNTSGQVPGGALTFQQMTVPERVLKVQQDYLLEMESYLKTGQTKPAGQFSLTHYRPSSGQSMRDVVEADFLNRKSIYENKLKEHFDQEGDSNTQSGGDSQNQHQQQQQQKQQQNHNNYQNDHQNDSLASSGTFGPSFVSPAASRETSTTTFSPASSSSSSSSSTAATSAATSTGVSRSVSHNTTSTSFPNLSSSSNSPQISPSQTATTATGGSYNSNNNNSSNNNNNMLKCNEDLLQRVSKYPRNVIFQAEDLDILEFIASGACGKVYKVAIKNMNSRIVAGKIAHETDAINEVLQEFDTCISLYHSNIVQTLGLAVLPAARSAPQLLLLMELADTNLQNLLKTMAEKAVALAPPRSSSSQQEEKRKQKEKKNSSNNSSSSSDDDSSSQDEEEEDLPAPIPSSILPWQIVLDWSMQIADGLQYLHSSNEHKKKIIHRDLKPANLLVSRLSKTSLHCTLLLTDMGLAKQSSSTSTSVTTTGGTLRYLSKEAMNSNKVSTRDDIYSFGCILHWFCVGLEPWTTNSGGNVCMAKILTENLTTQKVFRPRDDACPPRLWDLLKRCLDSNPKSRPKDGSALVSALQEIIENPSAPSSSSSSSSSSPETANDHHHSPSQSPLSSSTSSLNPTSVSAAGGGSSNNYNNSISNNVRSSGSGEHNLNHQQTSSAAFLVAQAAAAGNRQMSSSSSSSSSSLGNSSHNNSSSLNTTNPGEGSTNIDVTEQISFNDTF